ncbi:MAG TPA: DUF1549 domain-containing protein [Verrucomicrobiae bacterium]|jgi:hypothetical protein
MLGRIVLVSTIICAAGLVTGSAAPSPSEELWYAKVEPLFDKHCFKCHGGVKQKSGLDLRSLENILKGGENGPAILPGHPDQSRLAKYILPSADPHMPPEERKQLSKDEIASVRDWISKLPAAKSFATLTNANGLAEYLAIVRKQQKPAWTPPAKIQPREAIDGFMAISWRERKIKPAPLCDDGTFVRRVYLDLAGRIPKESEVEAFLKDRQGNYRERLVDSLLASDDYARHFSEIFDVVFMGRRGGGRERRAGPWREYLTSSFAENRPWDQIIRDLIIARPSNTKEKGAVFYLYERRDNYQEMAEAIAPVAFGVQIGCAQCHNHPLAAEIEQRHYWGLVAALNRSKNIEAKSGPGISESAIGGFVSFANLKKESQPALLALLNGKLIAEKRLADGEKEKDVPDLYLVPPPKEKEKAESPAVPKFSRRAALADALTHDNPFLARAFVNRIWASLLGRGLVHPVDAMDSRHRPSHPDLLDWIARDFERNGYDIKHLVRQIVLSRAYQLDSKWKDGVRPPPNAFARALDKPLSAEQLYRSLLIATGHDLDATNQVQLRQALKEKFPDLFAPDYNPTLQQALLLSNSPLLDALLEKQSNSTTAKILALDTSESRIAAAFKIVLGRQPDKDEAQSAKLFLAKRNAETGTRELLWALLASAEFQLNH